MDSRALRELIDEALPAGETLRIAPATWGFYCGDIDDLGNTIQEYVYAYKWDYTRDRYFNRTNLSIWRAAPLTDKVFAWVEAARYIGYERIWGMISGSMPRAIGIGIFGDDWKHINDYLLKTNGLSFPAVDAAVARGPAVAGLAGPSGMDARLPRKLVQLGPSTCRRKRRISGFLNHALRKAAGIWHL